MNSKREERKQEVAKNREEKKWRGKEKVERLSEKRKPERKQSNRSRGIHQ